MKVTINSKKGLKTDLKIFVDKDTINKKMEERLAELKNTVNLKGFRPGKVPIHVLKRQFGKMIYGEVLDKTLQETSSEALKTQKIKAAGQPKIDIKSHGEDKDLEYSIIVEELPKIKIDAVTKIQSNNYDVEVSSQDIENRLSEIAQNQKNYINKKEDEVSENQDLLLFDYKATIDGNSFEGGEGKNTQIILGKNLFIKNFDNNLLGLKKNDEKEFEIYLPENYPKAEYANKKAKFICKILEIKKPEKASINDSFAKNLGAKNLIDLKELIKKQIKNQYKNTLDSITKKEILNQLENFKDIKIPQSLVDQEIEVITKNLKKEEIIKNKKENEDLAKKRIKVGLILNEFGEQNNLKVTEEELKNEIQKQIQAMPSQSKQIMEYYQKNPSAAVMLRGGIYEDKIIALIKAKAKTRNKILSVKEAEKIILGENKQATKKEIVQKKLVKTKKKTTKSHKKNK